MSPPSESPERGHRTLPHTADVTIEAWGPDPSACIEEAVLALTGSFASIRSQARTHDVPVEIAPAPLDEQLAVVLDEVVYLVDARSLVVVSAELHHEPDGRLAGTFRAVPVADVESTGSAAKAVSYGDLTLTGGHGSWRCRATIDV